MFGFSLAAQLFQGSAQRTWNCVTQFTNQLWYKFNHFRHPVMPRSRRRHHSRSRSRSRSHSHDRDRDAKRRKIDTVDSPAHKRSVSSEPQSPVTEEISEEVQKVSQNDDLNTSQNESLEENVEKDVTEDNNKSDVKGENPNKQIEKLKTTPNKVLSPKQLQKKLESEKKRQQRQQEREERERKKQEEKERIRLEKEQVKKERNELKAKERELKEEQKRKEREEKEAKRKEKEEREEAKRKEREQEKIKKQQEIEEKNREKQKIEEQKQKASQAFVNFFVPKKTETKSEEPKTQMFMPFEIKSDMRLAPLRRNVLTDEEKNQLIDLLNSGESFYLKQVKDGKKVRRSLKTWPFEEEVIIVEEDIGESICEDKQKLKKMRVKFLKFHENKRPPYYGTWRKKSFNITGRKPFKEDKQFFDYEVESDDDWEEEEQGESLNGSDDEEKENEVENEDYEVDNDFFVPHGHLSDDEVDDEELAKLSPESHKQKLKLLKDEFDQDMKAKTNKMKPRSIGCIWYKKDKSNVDDAIDRHLRPLAIITNGQIIIRKRKDLVLTTPKRAVKELQPELIPQFLKLIQGNVNKKTAVVEEFMNYMRKNGHAVEVSKSYLGRCLKQHAQWKKCIDPGPNFNKFCWCLEEEVKKKYNLK